MIGALVVTMATTVAVLPHTKTGKGPAVVLVHGMGGDRSVWGDAAKKLAETHTVIAVDLPGHGEAAAPAKVDFDAIARQIAATVRAEKAAPAVIVGHSLGGCIAGHVPLVDPGLVRALVIVDSGIGALWSPKQVDELKAKLKQDREATLKEWFGGISKPAQAERVIGGARKLSDAALLGYPEALATQPVPDGGRAIAVPVLLMATKLLMPEPKKRAETLAALGFANVKNLKVEYFDQSMHWPFWDEPEKFSTVLAKFLASVEK